VTSIALHAVIPAGIGYWLDGRWGTSPWLLIAGTVIGFVSMMWELIKFSQKRSSNPRSTPPSESPKT
jgi:F0F1-type ATP synthase assembly protein I